MELHEYVRILRNHWVGVLVLTIFGIAVAAGYTATQTKVYAANANGFVTAGTASDPALASVNDSLAKSRAASYVDIATSRAVADLAIDGLGLDTSAASLVGKITVSQPEGTVLIKIRAESSSPKAAQALADAWVVALAERVDEIENPDGSTASGVLGVEPVEAAALPTAPVSPNPKRNLIVGMILGLILGVGYAVTRTRLDRRLREPANVERRFGVPTIGQVPLTKGASEADRATTPLAAGQDRRNWGTAEAYRKLRTNLAYMSVDNPPRVIVITSPRPSDGKSTTASNLAVAIALSGQDVVLVDADLRRPTMAQTLGLVEGAGLTDLLIGTVTIDDVLQSHPAASTLRVLAAGSVPPNPSELLSSKAMRNVLTELSKDRMVIIDAPPVLPVTDAAVLTRSSDGAIIVVSYGSTLDSELEETLHQLNTVQATILGIVFNRVPAKGSAYGAYYGGYYYSRTLDGEVDGVPVPSTGRRKAGTRTDTSDA